ncbi:hypothetical protein F8568_004235 [Actinomadura sp. LD22]|uniref:Uncharacterized protein n=1 Tax=Actinomadura physcomitrii TaxID=2650748 RepID=A0A6I4M5M3_9ACTN|nr:hypothetical protein [Actinomadura physcomitrii]MVZ99594.1 hypothetical protein [Actinomadura physcomitrii]
MGGEERALRLTAREEPRRAPQGRANERPPDDRAGDRGPERRANGPRAREVSRSRTGRSPRRGAGEYALRSMLSSAWAHDRAADWLEDLAAVDPEEALAHLESAERHRRWADADRDLAERYGTRHQDPDGL